ncbi:sterol desaturase family protein [Thorsellia kenyensis]|uniref:Sterol desaturase family protein n=1 Tax=Thorsellia kenyensis TaxID=1549888 RepID=A0ABV6CBW7_9GAMM
MSNENLIRLSLFLLSVIIFGLLEYLFPSQKLKSTRFIRWSINYSCVIIASFLMRILLPISATGAAIIAEKSNIGLFNQFLLSSPVVVVISILLFDLLIYLQHLAFHAIPLFWRLHQVHHIDESIDTSTALRFHPLEFLFSMGIKIGFIFLLGIPFLAVLLFEIILNSMAIFNHANLKLPQKLDKYLRLFLVTPDMHRIHHSTLPSEFNSNFGFNLSVWDKLFKTYIQNPSVDTTLMPIGQKGFEDRNKTTLFKMLLHPINARIKK